MTFNDLFASMIVFFFWFMAIWIFIQIFADIFHRRDLSGGAKAGWILLLFVLPFLGALIYLIARGESMRARAMSDMAARERAQRAYIQDAAGYVSIADELVKLAELRDRGVLTSQEFEAQKAALIG